MIDIGLGHYLTLGAIIFTIGIVGIFLNRKNIIVILMSIELILLAVNINLVAFSMFLNDISGQIFTLFILIYKKKCRKLLKEGKMNYICKLLIQEFLLMGFRCSLRVGLHTKTAN